MKILKIVGLVVLILIIVVLGIRFFSGPEDTWLCRNGQWIKHGKPSAPQPTADCDNTLDIVAPDPLNAIYTIESKTVTLTDGRSTITTVPEGESASTEIYQVFGQPVYGDINGDQTDDAVIFLTANYGGSGTFFYVAAAIKNNIAMKRGDQNYVYQGKNAILLGDRIAPQNIEIRNGFIIANYADRKADEPMAARPSVGVSKYLELDSGVLKEIKISDQDIIVDVPAPLGLISSPLTIKGRARGTWFFEASFPVQLVEDSGAVLASGIAQLDCPVCPPEIDCAACTWMTTEFVPFTARLEYNFPNRSMTVTSGRLILKKDNPSGLPEHDNKIEIPVMINLIPDLKMSVKAFFGNNKLDPEISCNKVFPVKRQVAKTAAAARAALEELLKGPSSEEKNQGYFTSLNPNVKIQKLTIDKGTAKVDFDETLEKAMGGSCRVSAVRAEIIETLKQFSTVKDVIISVNGRTEDILQP